MKKKASPRIGFGLSHQRDLTVNIVCQPSIFEDIGTRGESTLIKTSDAQRKEVFGGGECEDHPTSVPLRQENAMPYQRTYRREQSYRIFSPSAAADDGSTINRSRGRTHPRLQQHILYIIIVNNIIGVKVFIKVKLLKPMLCPCQVHLPMDIIRSSKAHPFGKVSLCILT